MQLHFQRLSRSLVRVESTSERTARDLFTAPNSERSILSLDSTERTFAMPSFTQVLGVLIPIRRDIFRGCSKRCRKPKPRRTTSKAAHEAWFSKRTRFETQSSPLAHLTTCATHSVRPGRFTETRPSKYASSRSSSSPLCSASLTAESCRPYRRACGSRRRCGDGGYVSADDIRGPKTSCTSPSN
jgi:hypothetical protein